jgi:hypothetical protein
MAGKWTEAETWDLITQIKLSENFKVLYGQAANEVSTLNLFSFDMYSSIFRIHLETQSMPFISALQSLFGPGLEKPVMQIK